ncbi:MOSC domain-containing protein [Pontibaca salina]|uniref:MOSC domain-containing protein n=1 Tax=Pontibaca salina TaxID=2795731 RepID=A0A934HMG6_9RHOB|nr:MOSC domain-containing protein [Pontibaca salina]MBI6630798.1 MOSC domain-containing protein [Pontibaca salina]
MIAFTISQVRIGQLRPLGPSGVASGIYKEPLTGGVMAERTGFAGDEQGDRRHHGGPDKALHAYAACNYPRWSSDLPEPTAQFQPGAFGENLVIQGAAEADIALGDQWQIGGALVEVSQGRQPCWRLNLRFKKPDMAKLVQATGRTGWYFRVLQPGEIAADDTGQLVSRPHPAWTITRVAHLLYHDCLNTAALQEFSALPCLPESWRKLARTRLSTGHVENWSRRIETPD